MKYPELDSLVNQLKRLEGENTSIKEQRVSLLLYIARKARRSAFRESLMLSYEKWKNKELADVAEVFEEQATRNDDLADLYKFRPRRTRQDRRELIAQEICEILFEDIDNPDEIHCKTPLNAKRLWPQELVRIYNLYKDKSLQDFEDPKMPSKWNFSELPEPYRTEWLDSLESGRSEISAAIGSTLLHWIDQRRRERNLEMGSNSSSLWNDLSQLKPSISWGELIWHCVSYIDESGGKERRQELDEYLGRDKRHCTICGHIFNVSKYHPGQLHCSCCSTRLRVQRHRARKRAESRERLA